MLIFLDFCLNIEWKKIITDMQGVFTSVDMKEWNKFTIEPWKGRYGTGGAVCNKQIFYWFMLSTIWRKKDIDFLNKSFHVFHHRFFQKF
jgi:hypothetical protein